MSDDLGAFLEKVREHQPRACEVPYPTWNEAVSEQAQLVRYIKKVNAYYTMDLKPGNPSYDQSPFKGLRIEVIRPGTLRFIWGDATPTPRPLPWVRSLTPDHPDYAPADPTPNSAAQNKSPESPK